jgi:hypothetical protein
MLRRLVRCKSTDVSGVLAAHRPDDGEICRGANFSVTWSRQARSFGAVAVYTRRKYEVYEPGAARIYPSYNLYFSIPFAFLESSIVIFSVLANNLNNTTTIKWDMCITL